MKKIFLVLITTLFLFTACQQATNENNEQDIHAHDHNGVGDPIEKDNTKVHPEKEAYICPMDCEEGKTYDKEGECPVCGMDLDELEEEG